jgi:hypothetical protein
MSELHVKAGDFVRFAIGVDMKALKAHMLEFNADWHGPIEPVLSAGLTPEVSWNTIDPFISISSKTAAANASAEDPTKASDIYLALSVAPEQAPLSGEGVIPICEITFLVLPSFSATTDCILELDNIRGIFYRSLVDFVDVPGECPQEVVTLIPEVVPVADKMVFSIRLIKVL